MTTYQPRLFKPTDAEYETIVQVFNLANPLTPGNVATWRHWDAHRDPARRFQRHVVEADGAIVAYAFTVRTSPEEEHDRFGLYAHPAQETEALLAACFSYLVDYCLAQQPRSLFAQVREDEPLKQQWLAANGFAPVMRYPMSMLDVAAFDPRPYAALGEKLAAQGIQIVSLARAAARDPDWQRHVYDLDMLLSQDVPRPQPFSPTPFETYVGREFEDPDFDPAGWFIALDGDTYVGRTSLFREDEAGATMGNDLTGVRRDYRRRGIATALKVQAIEWARGQGVQRIITHNEENNPMYQLNRQLGFMPQPADVDWEKRLDESEQ